jgi:hypothetical protein
MADIIVAGNTSGSITISAPLVAGSGVLTLPTGTDTLIGKATTDTLTNKSIAATQLTGTVAAARLPAGSVLQVVNATREGNSVTTSSASDVSWGATASITPTSSSSKIYVIASGGWYLSAGTATEYGIAIQRNGVTIPTGGNDGLTCVFGAGQLAAPYVITILDTPATTSVTTYLVVAHRINPGTCTLSNGIRATQLNEITLMEIAA